VPMLMMLVVNYLVEPLLSTGVQATILFNEIIYFSAFFNKKFITVNLH
jgi:hypothetical protein